MLKQLNKILGGFDGVLKNTIHTSREGYTGVLTQPTRNLILERNKELRKNPGAIRDLSFGRQAASIPIIDYLALKKKHPILNHPDARIRSAEMIRVLKLPENSIFHVQEKF